MTELKDAARVRDLRSPAGLDNLLYSADTYFSCFADLALTSPVEYFREGQGSLMQCVITPAAPYMPWTNEAIAEETAKQVRNGLQMKWAHSAYHVKQAPAAYPKVAYLLTSLLSCFGLGGQHARWRLSLNTAPPTGTTVV